MRREGKSMQIKIDMNSKIKLCPYCFGSGKLKAMQSVAVCRGVSARSEDIQVECKHCKGIGLIIK